MRMRGGKKSARAKDDFDVVGDSRQNDAGDRKLETVEVLKPEDTSVESLRKRQRTRRRMKSVSDGVALMTRMSFSQTPPLELPEPVPEEEEEDERHKNDLSRAMVVLDPNVSVTSSVESDNVSLGGHSDTDDVPQVEMELGSAVTTEHRRPSLRERLRRYYLSKRFVLLSNVFGTLVAFFFIAQRVEGFFVSEGLVDSQDFVVFAFPTTITFWVLFTWLLLFLTGDTLIFYSVWSSGVSATNRERQAVIAAILDVIISGTCLIILCAAETQRCCEPSEEENSYHRRFLEDYKSTDVGYGTAYDPQPAPCSCPAFGSRTYGGLGTVEPYTSLVVLRMLRHWVAKRIVLMVWPESPSGDGDKYDEALQPHGHSSIRDPFAVFGDSHGRGSMEDERGTISGTSENCSVCCLYCFFIWSDDVLMVCVASFLSRALADCRYSVPRSRYTARRIQSRAS